MTILTAILGFLSQLPKLFSKVLDYFREKKLVQTGKELEAAELAKKEIDINRQQTEILSQTRTKEQTEEKLRHGKF